MVLMVANHSLDEQDNDIMRQKVEALADNIKKKPK